MYLILATVIIIYIYYIKWKKKCTGLQLYTGKLLVHTTTLQWWIHLTDKRILIYCYYCCPWCWNLKFLNAQCSSLLYESCVAGRRHSDMFSAAFDKQADHTLTLSSQNCYFFVWFDSQSCPYLLSTAKRNKNKKYQNTFSCESIAPKLLWYEVFQQ